MSILTVRRLHLVALGTIAACAVSLPVMAGGGPDCGQKVTRMDVEGGNGNISASDHAAGAQKRFETMDTDKDGRLTAQEVSASHGAESIFWAQHKVATGERIKKLDSNNDGSLTAAEYAAGSQKMFEKLDVNADGFLTPAEVQVDDSNRRAQSN
jgi:EF hand